MSVLEEPAWLAVIAAVEQQFRLPGRPAILLRIFEQRAEPLDGLHQA